MFRIIFAAAVLLFSSPVVYAQQELSAESQQALQDFLAMDSLQKNSVITEMLAMKKFDEVHYLIAAWEKNAQTGQGPSDFLKSYIDTVEKSSKEGSAKE